MEHAKEHISPEHVESPLAYVLYLRHLRAYEFAGSIIGENCNVLDIGCGEGYGAAYLANSSPTINITALDVREDSIKHAQNKYPLKNCQYIHYDGHGIPQQDSSFDVVLCFQVIEHIKDDYGFISETHRLLKPNGVLIMTTPNKTHRLISWQKPWNTYHVREYYPKELVQLCARTFAQVDIKGVFGNEGIQRLEINRVKSLKGHRYFLRVVLLGTIMRAIGFFMPKSLKEFFKKLLLRGSQPVADGCFNYKTSDYCIKEQLLDESLDLLAICRK